MSDLAEIVRRLIAEHGAAAITDEVAKQTLPRAPRVCRPKGSIAWTDADRVVVYVELEIGRRVAGRLLDYAAHRLLRDGAVSVAADSQAAAQTAARLRGLYYEGKDVLARWGTLQRRRYETLICNSVRIRSKAKQK
jgi:hypothetical protein